MKTAIQREQRKACFSDAEREQFGQSQKAPAGLQELL